MKINFRQGLVSFQQSGSQALFLVPSATAGYVDLNVAPTPFIATIAHGDSDYLLKFDTVVAPAWGPMTSGVDNYLYLEINVISGAIVHGISVVEPVTSTVEPASSVAGAMWFDLNENVMKVRNNNNTKWVPSPRVVVGYVQNGNTNQITHYTAGSSVGLNTPTNAGYLLYDSQLRPLRSPSGELLTADTPVRVKTTVGTSGVLTNPVNNFIPVRAAEPIPAMSLVYFSSADTVSLASSNPALVMLKTPIGLVENALAMNEVGVITQSGEVTYDQWNWSASDFGKPVYCGYNGEVVTTRPQSVQAYRVGYVKNAKTILFYVDSETIPQVIAEAGAIISGIPPITAVTAPNELSEIITTISMSEADDTHDGYMTMEQAAQLGTFETRITTAEADIDALETGKSDVGHSHVVADVTGLQADLDALQASINLKMSTVPSATLDNLASFNALGQAQDSGYKAADFSPVVHIHTIAQVTDLQTNLDAKAPLSHTHSIANVTGLQTDLDNRAFVNHTHTVSNVSGLQTALDGKAPLTHTHVILDVSGLQEALDAKSNLSHIHAITDVTGLQTALNNKANLTHSHTIADVINLQTTLDGKTNIGHTHVAANITDFSEAVDDRVNSLLVAGNNITLIYNDSGNQLEIQANIPGVDPLKVQDDTDLTFNEYSVTDALAFGKMNVAQPTAGRITVVPQTIAFFEGASARGTYPGTATSAPVNVVFGSGLTATQSGVNGETLTVASTAPQTLSALDDVDLSTPPVSGDSLVFNGTDWAPQSTSSSSFFQLTNNPNQLQFAVSAGFLTPIFTGGGGTVQTQGPVNVSNTQVQYLNTATYQSYNIAVNNSDPVSSGFTLTFLVRRQAASIGANFAVTLETFNGSSTDSLIISYSTHSANPTYQNALRVVSNGNEVKLQTSYTLFPLDTSEVKFSIVVHGTTAELFVNDVQLGATFSLDVDYSVAGTRVTNVVLGSNGQAGAGTGAGSPGYIGVAYISGEAGGFSLDGVVVDPTFIQVDTGPNNDVLATPNLRVADLSGTNKMIMQQPLQLQDHGNPVQTYPVIDQLQLDAALNFGTGLMATRSGTTVTVTANLIESITVEYVGT